MTTFGGLHVAASGLMAAQHGMEVTAHNMSNASTKGFSRQRLDQRAASLAMAGSMQWNQAGIRGNGVEIVDIVRVRDGLLDRSWRSDAATHRGWETRAEYAGRAQRIMGPLEGGAVDALGAFFTAWDQLSLRPTDPTARQAVLAAGETLSRALNTAAEELDTMSTEALAAIKGNVVELNDLSAQVALLNGQIKSAVVGGQNPNDLLDQRDNLVDRMAQLAGVTVRPTENGGVDVYLGGLALVRDADADAVRVDDSTQPVVLRFDAGDYPLQPSGELGAHLEWINTTTTGLLAQLDTIAAGLVNTVNTAHRSGYDQDGQTGIDFFDPTGTSAAVIRVDANLTIRDIAASASGGANDGNHAIAMAQLRRAQAVGTETLLDSFTNFTGRLGLMSRDANNRLEASDAVMSALDQSRTAVSGVNTDEELTNMIRYQKAFEASARVMTAIDQMLDKIINGMGLVGR